MPKITIDFPEDMGVLNAMAYVTRVINGGRVSEAGGIQHYCWHTTFGHDDHVSVTVRQKRTPESADSFLVMKSGKSK